MLIHEAAKLCEITKKAVQYYVEQGLIFPSILGNGYQDFSEQDVKQLKQIVLYRKLGLSVSEIRLVFDNPNSMSGVLYQKTLELEREKVRHDLLKRIANGEKLEDLENEINNIHSGTVIIKKLLDLFPGYYGKFISFHFSRYLNGTINTPEQLDAFYQIIEFLDNAPDIRLPEDLVQNLEEYQEALCSGKGETIFLDILEKKEKAFQNIDVFVGKYPEYLK